MKKDELIQEAYRRYPIGTFFKSIFSDRGKVRKVALYCSQKDIKWRWSEYCKGEIEAYNGIHTPSGSGLKASPSIYKDGKWAPIVNNQIY